MQILNISDHFRKTRVKKSGERQGSRIIEGGRFTLLGTTMVPRFTHHDYVGGAREELIEKYPGEKELIIQLNCADQPLNVDGLRSK